GELLDREGYLWSFVRVEGVEGDEQRCAGRGSRMQSSGGRVSGGTDSERGSRFVERVLSVVASCRPPAKLSASSRNVLEFLTACCRAQLNGEPPPSLLPQGRLSHRAA
ncbi:MAG TPA: IS66 family transposase, partial [Planctomycetes bacterium]|nr:IS66 family transposase [Planctomycetota bacterium]